MGMFKDSKLNEAKTSGGGRYLMEEGRFEIKITSFKGIKTRAKESALVADFQILASDTQNVKTGSTYNFYAGENDDMFAGKVKALLIAASGLSEAEDTDEIEKIDFDDLLEKCLLNPKLIIGNKLFVDGVRMLKKDGKKAAKADPSLLDDKEWYKKNSFVRLDFSYHPDQRAQLKSAS